MQWVHVRRGAAAAAAFLFSMAASAVTTISGSLVTTSGAGGNTQVNYTCQGTPTCSGTYTATLHDNGCNATNTFSGNITITGLDTTQPTSSGNVTLTNFTIYTSPCPTTAVVTQTGSYTATSDGNTGTVTVQAPGSGGGTITLQGTFTVGSSSNVRVSGQWSVNLDATHYFRISYSCTGMPTCIGTSTVDERDDGCSNAFSWSSNIVVNGLDLSRPGTFSGTSVHYGDSASNINADGTCTYRITDNNPRTRAYTATWDGTNGTTSSTFRDDHGNTLNVTGTFTASGITPPPSFPMTVTSNITPTNANVTAVIQPKAADVGTTQSIFVFAYAPQSLLAGKALKDGPDPCVLAQVNSNGQLTSASTSTLTPTTTTVLTSQGTLVTVLGNVPTPNVAGTTMYVGYGPNSTTMFGNGNYQGVVNVPGASRCTTNLATSAAPATPGALTGLWWKSDESGWGIHFTQRGSNVFAAWYTYDATGKPKWYVSTCSGFTGTSGTCNGTVYEVTGPNFFGGAFNASVVNAANAGTLQLTFANANAASMTYTVAGQTRTNVPLTRQPLGADTTTPAVNFSDIWWGGQSESGWGMAMAQQAGTTFLAWYVYDANGKPTWLVATCTMSGNTGTGALYRTSGPPFGPTFDASRVTATQAGTITVNFTDPNNAILDYTVDGVSGRKAVTRQVF